MFQPANVPCACVGLLTINAVSNVALVGAVAPLVPSRNTYAIVYVFASHALVLLFNVYPVSQDHCAVKVIVAPLTVVAFAIDVPTL